MPETPIYRLMLKPRACLATLAPSGDAPDAGALPARRRAGLQVVAPLDFPAEGVVLLTTDGELAQAHRASGSRVADDLPPQAAGAGRRRRRRAAAQGLALGGAAGQARRSVEPLAATEKNTWIEMVVAETRPRALKAAGDVDPPLAARRSRASAWAASRSRGWNGRLARPDEGRDRRPPQARRARLRPATDASRVGFARATRTPTAISDKTRRRGEPSWRRFPGR